jgi:hypothetical protein
MLGKLSIIGAVAAITVIPQRCPLKWGGAPLIPASTLGPLLIQALAFVVPSSEVSWPGFGDLALAEWESSP